MALGCPELGGGAAVDEVKSGDLEVMFWANRVKCKLMTNGI